MKYKSSKVESQKFNSGRSKVHGELLNLIFCSPNFKNLSAKDYVENNELAFSVAEKHLGITRALRPEEMKKPDKLTLLSYLSLFYELFRDLEPAPPPSDEEPEAVVAEENSLLMSMTPKDEKSPIAAKSRSEDKKEQLKKKRKSSFFRRSSKKKMMGASPSSAERYSVVHGRKVVVCA